MEHRISATKLARALGSVLSRVRYRGDSFLVERNGEPVARLLPVASASPTSLAEALGAWQSAGEPEPEFADVLDQIGELDGTPDNPWAS